MSWGPDYYAVTLHVHHYYRYYEDRCAGSKGRISMHATNYLVLYYLLRPLRIMIFQMC